MVESEWSRPVRTRDFPRFTKCGQGLGALRSADSSMGSPTNQDAVRGAGASALGGETSKVECTVSLQNIQEAQVSDICPASSLPIVLRNIHLCYL